MSTVIEDKKIASKLPNFAGIPMVPFLAIATVVVAGIFLEKLPKGMIGALVAMMVIGAIMEFIGDRTPIIKDYFGGAPIVAIFGTAFLVHYKLMPESTVKIITDFMKGGGFLDFYIAALITGSILGMNSKLLISAGSRFAVPLLGGVLTSFVFVALVGGIIGYGWKESILQIAMPIMGGGMGAGAVPMSQIYNKFLGIDVKQILSILIPALALGNLFSIIGASLLDKLGKKIPQLTGHGQLMQGYKIETEQEEKLNLQYMGIGILVACTFFTLGAILNKFIPAIHSYALMIIAVAIFKISGVVPAHLESGANQWYKFVAKNFTMALLVGIGVAYTSVQDVINAISIQYVILVAVVVFGAVVGAGLFGRIVGFYPIEAAITAGLCMANMGGTGDVAVLSASNRMQLMPFAQISSRLGGALLLIIASVIVPLLT